MIRAIVAIDDNRGMATDKGIPWRLPADIQYFRDKTSSGLILMGYGTYIEFNKPFHNRTNYVATKKGQPLKPGFETVTDACQFLDQHKHDDVWVIGGAGLLAETMDKLDELYITQLNGDFHCTKFLPAYKSDFALISEGQPITENGITFRFQVWQRHK